MKKVIVIASSIFLFSCTDYKKTTKNQTTNEVEAEYASQPDNADYKFLYSNWVGMFDPVKYNFEDDMFYANRYRINLIIDKVTDNLDVYGWVLYNGDKKKVTGKVFTQDSKILLSLKEEGEGLSNGEYKITVSNSKDKLEGTYATFDKDATVSEREFNLTSKTFSYDPKIKLAPSGEVDMYSLQDQYTNIPDDKNSNDVSSTFKRRRSTDAIYKINASTEKLTEKQLSNLTMLDLEIIANTIYARHGYNFGSPSILQYFFYRDWFVPMYDNVQDKLTPIEKDNISLMEKVSKNAKDNYEELLH